MKNICFDFENENGFNSNIRKYTTNRNETIFYSHMNVPEINYYMKLNRYQ